MIRAKRKYSITGGLMKLLKIVAIGYWCLMDGFTSP